MARTKAERPRRTATKPSPRQRQSASANAFADLLASVKPEIDLRLAGFLEARMDRLAEHGPDVAVVTREIARLSKRGGKRLRAALVVTGLVAAETPRSTPLKRGADRSLTLGADRSLALDVGVSLELMHAYFLIHDDWMDQDQKRRGGPSVHAALGRRFGSQHLGAAAAVLAGDYAAAIALELLTQTVLGHPRLPELLARFAQMQQAAVIGQELDLLGRGGDVEETYRQKTSSYTVRGPLFMGAELASAPAELFSALERFSAPAGVAFQLRDDLLGVFGDPKQTGKPLGSDLVQGKRTLLLQHFHRMATPPQKRAVAAVFGKPAGSGALKAATSALEASGARAAVERRIVELSAEATRALAHGALGTQGRELLRGALAMLVERTA